MFGTVWLPTNSPASLEGQFHTLLISGDEDRFLCICADVSLCVRCLVGSYCRTEREVTKTLKGSSAAGTMKRQERQDC